MGKAKAKAAKKGGTKPASRPAAHPSADDSFMQDPMNAPGPRLVEDHQANNPTLSKFE